MRLSTLVVAVLVCVSASAHAENKWEYLGDLEGVVVSQKVVTMGVSGGYGFDGRYDEALGKFENTNGYRVHVRYVATLNCKDGTHETKSSEGMVMLPHSVQAGEGSGLWWRGCQDRIRDVEFDVSVHKMED